MTAAATAPHRPLPRGPVLGWASFTGAARAGLPALDDLPHQCPTTSGRAALALALHALQRPHGSAVLLPSYHCPSMAAAVVEAGLVPVFYPLDDALAPAFEQLALVAAALPDTQAQGGVLLVAHYFGQARSLAAARQWCDERGWALIEDCAHSWFGQAGERPVGHWGDYAIGSSTKFFPVREGGLLASARCSCVGPARLLHGPGWRAQVRTLLGLLAAAHRHGRLAGASTLPGWLEQWLTSRQAAGSPPTAGFPGPPAAATPTTAPMGYDMRRCRQKAWASTEWLRLYLPRARVVHGRQRVWQRLADHAAALPGVRVWSAPHTPPPAAPYVLPLWVSREPDAVYQHLRAAGVPVFRWDERWPGAEATGADAGALAARHLLQLPCHPDYTEGELRFVTQALTHATRQPAAARPVQALA